eukprot:m.49371 g.49371  ORF g.49371 m.49371 type:complete len:584 (+) comp10615_c0_seq1:2991-4742(+)
MSWVVGRSLVQSVQRRAYMSLRCRSFSIVAPNKNTCRAGIVGVQLSSTFDSKDGHFNFFTVMGMSASALLLGQFGSVVATEQASNGGTRSPRNEQVCAAAARGDNDTLAKLLGQQGDPNARHKHGWTPLLCAAVNSHANTCRMLLENGANVDMPDEYFPDSYEKLRRRQMEFDRDLTHPHSDTRGFTALHYACLASAIEVVKVLLEFHANPTVEDMTGCKAIDYAIDKSIIDMLKEYQEKGYPEHLKQIENQKREQRKIFPLEKRVKQYIVGQEGPVNSVAAAIRRKENGWHDGEHPLVFLFLGSSGLGKTELAKQIASYIHGDEKDGFIRVDMTEYQSKHEAAKLIGSPPGYVGFEEGGQLTKMLAKKPNAVVLLDEVEKAHPDVLNLMLQLFDEGRITDGQGTTVECKDAIFVMTSNLASDEIAQYGVELRREARDQKVEVGKNFKQKVIRPILKSHFQRDEFLGRIDQMLYFLPFSESELRKLVELQLQRWAQKAKERHSIILTWDNATLDLISNEYDVHYGARSLQHAVDQLVISEIANAHENGNVVPGCRIDVTTASGAIALQVTQPSHKGTGSWSLF